MIYAQAARLLRQITPYLTGQRRGSIPYWLVEEVLAMNRIMDERLLVVKLSNAKAALVVNKSADSA